MRRSPFTEEQISEGMEPRGILWRAVWNIAKREQSYINAAEIGDYSRSGQLQSAITT
jgi:hypothetical protein